MMSVVSSIPDELLVRIFKHAAPAGPRRELLASKDNIRITHVSRRFRAVAIDTSELWSVVTNVQSREMRSMCLTRSKSTELRVFLLLVDRGTEDYTKFLADVIPHAAHWGEFYFRTGEELTDYIHLIQKLSGLCRGLSFPLLSKMTLVYPNPTFYETEGEGLDDYKRYDATTELFHFYKTWSTPHLSKLRARNLIPLSTGSVVMDECEVKLRSGCPEIWRVGALVNLASSWVNLKKLTFHLGILDADEEEPIPKLFLPELEDVSLQLCSSDWTGFNNIIDALHMPKVKSMEVSLSAAFLSSERALDESVRVLFPEHEEYRELHTFRFCSKWRPGREDGAATGVADYDNTFNVIISRLPGIRHLTIDAPGFVPPKSLTASMPPLHTLSLRRSNEIGMDFVKLVLDDLRKRPEWGNFMSLEVMDCAKLERVRLEELLQREKVFWVSNVEKDSERTDSEPEYDWEGRVFLW